MSAMDINNAHPSAKCSPGKRQLNANPGMHSPVQLYRRPASTRDIQTWIAMLMFAIMIGPATALDEPYALSHAASRQRAPVDGFYTFLLVFGGYAIAVSSNMLGPLMGITSVLWLTMRNDSAINPRASWMVFGAWSILTLMYFVIQCNRVSNHRLYIFLSLASASICMCIVALIQRSSLQSGLVTVIPPCTSFSAYAVAYFFPSRYTEVSASAV